MKASLIVDFLYNFNQILFCYRITCLFLDKFLRFDKKFIYFLIILLFFDLIIRFIVVIYFLIIFFPIKLMKYCIYKIFKIINFFNFVIFEKIFDNIDLDG